MDTPSLVAEEVRNQGAKLTEALGDHVSTSAWILDQTSEQPWRLLLAMSSVDSEGPRAAYQTVQRELPTDQWITMSRITVVSPRDPVVRAIRSILGRIPFSPSGHPGGNLATRDVHIYAPLVYKST